MFQLLTLALADQNLATEHEYLSKIISLEEKLDVNRIISIYEKRFTKLEPVLREALLLAHDWFKDSLRKTLTQATFMHHLIASAEIMYAHGKEYSQIQKLMAAIYLNGVVNHDPYPKSDLQHEIKNKVYFQKHPTMKVFIVVYVEDVRGERSALSGNRYKRNDTKIRFFDKASLIASIPVLAAQTEYALCDTSDLKKHDVWKHLKHIQHENPQCRIDSLNQKRKKFEAKFNNQVIPDINIAGMLELFKRTQVEEIEYLSQAFTLPLEEPKGKKAKKKVVEEV